MFFVGQKIPGISDCGMDIPQKIHPYASPAMDKEDDRLGRLNESLKKGGNFNAESNKKPFLYC